MSYTHLHVHSNFSFLDGGSSVIGLLDRARSLGFDSLAITDHNGLYGAVRFYSYAREIGVKPIVGVEIDIESPSPQPSPVWERGLSLPSPILGEGAKSVHHLTLLAKNLRGYSNLCKLITRSQLAHEKGEAKANLEMLSQYYEDVFCLSGCSRGEIALLLADGKVDEARDAAKRLIDVYGRESFLIEMQNQMLPGQSLLNQRLCELSQELGVRCVATNNVHYAAKDDFKVQDLLVCVGTLTTLDQDHPQRKRNGEYYVKSARAMANLFRKYPRAVAATDWVARQCNLDLGLGSYQFPGFPVPEGETAYSFLCKLCFGAVERLYKPITPQVTRRLQQELGVINQLGFSEYFLVVWDIVRYARSRGVRCCGRGSAAASLVSHCLGITAVDPIEHGLLFERFMNEERSGLPDIDIDFDSARRDEVINYIYKRYGEDRVAIVCAVSTLQASSAVRDLGKALDYPQPMVDKLASKLPLVPADQVRATLRKLPEFRGSGLNEGRFEALVGLCEKAADFPHHISVHIGGVVIGSGMLTELVPLQRSSNGTVISQYDKDDIEALGLVKMDILSLRNLSVIEDTLALVREHHGVEIDIDGIPLDDQETYDLLRRGATIGCFQIESPGMRGVLGRLQPEGFGDLIAQVSLFRPGPLQADMIEPFIARKRGEEPVTYLHPSLEPILEETCGVILYQEQVIAISHALAGFDLAQADALRRAMTKDRSPEEMGKIRDAFVAGALGNGVDPGTASKVFDRLRVFAAYGLCKAHAACFARTAYQTAYLKAHYPAEFLVSVLNNQPMGYYPAHVILEEGRRLGVDLLAVDINRSVKEHCVEYRDSRPGMRIGLGLVKGISDAELESILGARTEQVFGSLSDFVLHTRCSRPTIEGLINCGAFDSLGQPRQRLMWLLDQTVSRRRKTKAESQGSLLGAIDAAELDAMAEGIPQVPEPTLAEQVSLDYEVLGLSTRCHLMSFYREKLARARVVGLGELSKFGDNAVVRVAGVVVVRVRPPTRSGAEVVFLSLEDETGIIDCTVFGKAYGKYGKVIMESPALIVEGVVKKSGNSISLDVSRATPVTVKYRS